MQLLCIGGYTLLYISSFGICYILQEAQDSYCITWHHETQTVNGFKAATSRGLRGRPPRNQISCPKGTDICARDTQQSKPLVQWRHLCKMHLGRRLVIIKFICPLKTFVWHPAGDKNEEEWKAFSVPANIDWIKGDVELCYTFISIFSISSYTDYSTIMHTCT